MSPSILRIRCPTEYFYLTVSTFPLPARTNLVKHPAHRQTRLHKERFRNNPAPGIFPVDLSQITSKRTGWGSHKYSVVSGIEALAQSALLCPVEAFLNWTGVTSS